MQINLLETFLTVAECGGFHRAARRLNVTQAAVSARIKQLEQILDVKLFDRGPGGTFLNDAGKFFQPYAGQIVTTWKHVSTDASRQFSGRVPLQLGAQLSIWDHVLVDLVVWMEAKMGKLPLTLNFNNEIHMPDAVRNALIDLAVTHEAATDHGLRSIELEPEKLLLVSDVSCAISDPELPLFINFGFGSEYDAKITEILPARAAQHIFLGNSAMGLRYLLQRGGMAYCSQGLIHQYLKNGTLVEVEGAPRMTISCFAIYNQDSSNGELIEAVIEGLEIVRN